MCWPAQLTHLLTHLHAALPEPDLLQTTSDFVFLHPDRVSSDTQTLLNLFRPPISCERPIELLETAVEFYQGPLLDGFTLNGCPDFEEWLTLERSVWERRHLSVLGNLIQSFKNVGDMSTALAYARNYLALAPFDAEMHRKMVELHLAGGERDLVMQQFERVVDLVHA